MASNVNINRYVILLQEYYSNTSKNITNIEIQVLSDFFNTLKPNFQKAVFNRCINESEFFPKMCKINKIYSDIVRVFNANLHKRLPVNKDMCPECKNTGLVIYYSDGAHRFKQKEFFQRFDELSPLCDKYMCCCYCNNGKNRQTDKLQPYSFLFKGPVLVSDEEQAEH